MHRCLWILIAAGPLFLAPVRLTAEEPAFGAPPGSSLPRQTRDEFPQDRETFRRPGDSAGGHAKTPLPSAGRPRGRDEGDERPSQSTGRLGTTVGALSLVLVLIVVGARLLKKHGPTMVAGLPEDVLQVLGKQHLDPRNSIHLVRCGSRILVLGLSPQGFQTLAELTDPVEIDTLVGACRRRNEEFQVAQPFRTLLQKYRTSGAHASDLSPGGQGMLDHAPHPKTLSALSGLRSREAEHG